MAVPIIAVGKIISVNSNGPLCYFPRAIQSGIVDLD